MWTGLTDSPIVTAELGEPGMIVMPCVVTVPRLPGVVGGTEHQVPSPGTGYRKRGPGTGSRCDRACSEYTGGSTGDY